MKRTLVLLVGCVTLGGLFVTTGACGGSTYIPPKRDGGTGDGGQRCNFNSDCTLGFCAPTGYCALCPETACSVGETCDNTTGKCVTCTASTCDAGGIPPDAGTVGTDAGKGDAGGCTAASCGTQACVNNVCVPCTTDPSCGRKGYICNNGSCSPGCRQTSDCSSLGAGYWCNGNNQCNWGCLPGSPPSCGSFCCNLGTCDTTQHTCTGFTQADGGINTGDGGLTIPDGSFQLPDGGSTTGLCFGGVWPTNGVLLIAFIANCGCDIPASCNVQDSTGAWSQSCAPLTGTCCISPGGLCFNNSDCCTGVCNNAACN